MQLKAALALPFPWCSYGPDKICQTLANDTTHLHFQTLLKCRWYLFGPASTPRGTRQNGTDRNGPRSARPERNGTANPVKVEFSTPQMSWWLPEMVMTNSLLLKPWRSQNSEFSQLETGGSYLSIYLEFPCFLLPIYFSYWRVWHSFEGLQKHHCLTKPNCICVNLQNVSFSAKSLYLTGHGHVLMEYLHIIEGERGTHGPWKLCQMGWVPLKLDGQ